MKRRVCANFHGNKAISQMKRTFKQIQLQPDDVLFFLHIPKTGGISMQTILESHFESEEICPLHTFATREKFEQYPPEHQARWRLVRGHMRYGSFSPVYRFVTQNPICVTVLREPIKRVVSEYRHILRHPQNWLHEEFVNQQVSLKEYVTNPKYAYLATNYQTFMLTGTIRGSLFMDRTKDREPLLSDAARLALAKQRLEQYAFVGLTEQYEASVALLAFTFDWEPPQEIPYLNTAPTKTVLDELDAATRAALVACNALDLELYRFAEALFAERYAQMRTMMGEAR